MGDATPAGYRDPAGRCGGVVLAARPEPIALDPATSALIVVDMQNAYASAGGYLDLAGFDVSATGPVIARIAQDVAAAVVLRPGMQVAAEELQRYLRDVY